MMTPRTLLMQKLSRLPQLAAAALGLVAAVISGVYAYRCGGGLRADVIANELALVIAAFLLIWGATGDRDAHRLTTLVGVGVMVGASIQSTLPIIVLLAVLAATRLPSRPWFLRSVLATGVAVLMGFGAGPMAQILVSSSQFICRP